VNTLKLRRILTQVHLYMAGFLAPAFLLVGITGGMDLAGFDAKTSQTPIVIAQEIVLDFDSPTLKQDVQEILDEAGIDFALFEKTPNGIKATLNEPNLQYSMMELHKGHGPGIFRTYQIIAAIALFLVVIGGLAVGLLAKVYRMPTLISAIIGTIGFAILASM